MAQRRRSERSNLNKIKKLSKIYMERMSSCSEDGLRKGVWTDEEDQILTEFISRHGAVGWSSLPQRAGLKRTAKSCRLRWLNYLRPDLVRGNITQDEEALIVRFHKLLGNRWSLIAGRFPGRSDNEIKNYWNTKLKRKVENGEYQDIVVNPSLHDQNKGKGHYVNEAIGCSSFPNGTVFRPKAIKCSKGYIDPTMSIQPPPPPPIITALHASSSTPMANDNLASECQALEKEMNSWGFEYNMDAHEIARLYEEFDI